MENKWVKEGEEKPLIDLNLSDVQPVEVEISSFLAEDLSKDLNMLARFKQMLKDKYPNQETKITIR